jgi:hypothetical protein
MEEDMRCRLQFKKALNRITIAAFALAALGAASPAEMDAQQLRGSCTWS